MAIRLKTHSRIIQFWTAVLCAAFLPTLALAHAPQWSIDPKPEPVMLRFAYSDGAPMAFAKVRVTDPAGGLFQMGNTDRDGRFSFAAQGFEAAVPWRIVAMGDEGHAIAAEVSKDMMASTAQLRVSVSSWAIWLLIGSVAGNLILVTAFYARKRSAMSFRSAPAQPRSLFAKPDTG